MGMAQKNDIDNQALDFRTTSGTANQLGLMCGNNSPRRCAIQCNRLFQVIAKPF